MGRILPFFEPLPSSLCCRNRNVHFYNIEMMRPHVVNHLLNVTKKASRKRHLFWGAVSQAISAKHMCDEWFWMYIRLAGWLAGSTWWTLPIIHSFFLLKNRSLVTKPSQNQTESRKGERKRRRRKKHSLSNFVCYKYIITIRGLHFHEDFVTEAAGLKTRILLLSAECAVQRSVRETMKWKRKNPINCPSVVMEKTERKMETKN